MHERSAAPESPIQIKDESTILLEEFEFLLLRCSQKGLCHFAYAIYHRFALQQRSSVITPAHFYTFRGYSHFPIFLFHFLLLAAELTSSFRSSP